MAYLYQSMKHTHREYLLCVILSFTFVLTWRNTLTLKCHFLVVFLHTCEQLERKFFLTTCGKFGKFQNHNSTLFRPFFLNQIQFECQMNTKLGLLCLLPSLNGWNVTHFRGYSIIAVYNRFSIAIVTSASGWIYNLRIFSVFWLFWTNLWIVWARFFLMLSYGQ